MFHPFPYLADYGHLAVLPPNYPLPSRAAATACRFEVRGFTRRYARTWIRTRPPNLRGLALGRTLSTAQAGLTALGSSRRSNAEWNKRE